MTVKEVPIQSWRNPPGHSCQSGVWSRGRFGRGAERGPKAGNLFDVVPKRPASDTDFAVAMTGGDLQLRFLIDIDPAYVGEQDTGECVRPGLNRIL